MDTSDTERTTAPQGPGDAQTDDAQISAEQGPGDAQTSAPRADGALSARVERLEQLVAELAQRVDGPARDTGASGDATTSSTPIASPTAEDTFWALTSLKSRLPAPGGVVYAGSVDVGLGHVEYQWGRPTEHLLESDWAEHAEAVGSLGHPLRLALLRRLLDAEHTVAQLVDELGLASTGVAYHHLSALQNGGWVTSPRRGTWTIPASRIVPLLAIITALEKG